MRITFLLVLSALVVLPAQVGRAATPARGTVDSYSRLRQLFAEPPAEYSTLPFFVWDGEVTEADIDRHMSEFHNQGIRGFFIHPRPGLITPYLSDRWFELIRYTVENAKKLGMEAWLYDENSYPSGFAGGHVPAEMPESWNEGQGLAMKKLASLTAENSQKCRLVLKRTGDRVEDVTSRIAAERGQSGDYSCFEVAYYQKRAWHGGFSYVDLLRPGVTEKFLEVTMRGYEKAIGDEFGKTVPGIFTDEPNIVPPPGKLTIRWTPDLFEQFEKRWGYDLRPKLLALYEETGDWRKVRHDFYGLLLELFIDRWSKPYFKYTEAKGLAFTGHYWEHGWPSPNDGPDNMAMYAWHHVPAIDMLFNQFAEGVNAQFGNVRAVKELASVANQLGRRRTLSETYGGAGWELRFEDMKRLGDWQYALGVNMMNQHLSFQTLAGARKYDYPQSFTYHEPWWKQYHVLADYYARLSLALSSGEQVNRILVLEPTSTMWMYSGTGTNNARRMELASAFQQFVTRLESMQVEYDLGCENMLKNHGKAAGGKFVIGRRSYDLVVVPPGTENLDSPTAALLEAYVASGGKVLSFVEAPGRVDGAESGRMAALAKSAAWVKAASPDDPAVKSSLLGDEFQEVKGKLFHQRRVMDGGQLLFVVNSSLTDAAGAKVKLKGAGVMRLDPFTGRIAAYPASKDGGSMVSSIELPPAGSLLLFVSDRAGAAPAAAPASGQERIVKAKAPLAATRVSPNALKIDYCDLKLAGAEDKDIYFYKAADKVFKHYGFAEGNPWNTAVQYKSSILDKKFAADSGFEATFRFEVAGAVDKSKMRAVVERPVLWKVSVNGKPVENRPGEWYLDRAFGVYEIGAHVIEGANEITIKAQPMSVHNELEPVYITGDFGVAAREAAGWKIVQAAELKTGPWKDQLLPMYPNGVSYGASFQLKKEPSYKVRLGKWNGTVAEVKVNGKAVGSIGWQPYELDITEAVMTGNNKIEVVVYGSLKNLLGPHHGRINRGLTSPWGFRSAPEHTPAASGYDLLPYGLEEEFQVVEAGAK